MAYDVKLIADSVNTRSVRLCTWVLSYPRFVHAELMTHRVFSRNAASSRAIPIDRMLAAIERDPVLPKFWGKNQSGMAAREELAGPVLRNTEFRWLLGRDAAVRTVRDLQQLGLHKQIANRVTEPWMFITVLVSSTRHANWFALRDHPDAQPELAWVASAMHDEYKSRRPTFVAPGDWHRPFLDKWQNTTTDRIYTTHEANLISAGRCAAVSYDNLGEGVDSEKDLARAERMLAARPLHASPFEHVAQSLNGDDEVGNFDGWLQLRKVVSDEAGPPEPRFMDCVPEVHPQDVEGLIRRDRTACVHTCQCEETRHSGDAGYYLSGVPGCGACSGTGRVSGEEAP